MKILKKLFIASVVLASSQISLHADPILPQNVATVETQEEQNALAQIDTLIQATQAGLERQKKLKILIEEYKKTENSCFAKPNDIALLFKLAKSGKQLYNAIQENGLTDYFQESFVEELKKLSAIADKKSIPPAK